MNQQDGESVRQHKGDNMKTEIYKTHSGYHIQINTKPWPLYVRSVRNNKAKCYLDYAHATGFTEKTARKYAQRIEAGTIQII